MLSGSLISLKDPNTQGLSYAPLLLCAFQFADGTSLYASTHNLNTTEGGNSFNGTSYLARVAQQDIAAIQARSEQGIDRISDVTIHLHNADQFIYTNYETDPGKGFKGAKLSLALVLCDIDPDTGNYVSSNDSPATLKFGGICDAPVCENGGQTLAVRATTAHSLARVVFPNSPVQQRCINPFPGTADQRLQGASDLSSWFYPCGYCPDQPATDPVTGQSATRGNTTTPNATDAQGNVIADANGIFTSCNLTKADCIARGMYDQDDQHRLTRRFTAIQWSPPGRESQSRQYTSGNWISVFSSRNDSIYARNYPLVYGQQWLKQPVIANILGDANSTRFEVVLCAGEIDRPSIAEVVVNGEIVPHLGDTTTTVVHGVTLTVNPSTELFRWSLNATGNRTGAFTGDVPWSGQGDPYGSLAMIEVVVHSEVAQGTGAPSIMVLMTGPKIKTPNTANPADQPNWPYVPTTLPPWVVLDLLIEGNHNYAEIDLQTFIDAANYCGVPVSYYDLTGQQKTHNRYICEMALEEKRSGQEVIQAVLRSFNAQLAPNSNTGLLQLFIRKTLADQQPHPINGSNFALPINSIHAEHTAANPKPGIGYVAYCIDESVILHEKGVPKMRGPYCQPTAQAPNRLTFPFQDADNQYADDSISVVEPADVARAGGYQAGGQQVPQQLAVLGISSFDQGIRICNTTLAENLRGNENGDSRGTRRWDIQVTARCEHLRSSDIVLLQYQAIDLAPAVPLTTSSGAVVPGILCRVESISGVSTNYERATLTLVWHEDLWYTDAFGQHATPIYSDPRLRLPHRLPYAWDPYGELAPAGGYSFQIAQSYTAAADGSALAHLTIGGCAPVNQFSSGPDGVQPPLITRGSDATVSPAGGAIVGGRRIYAAIAAQDANGKWSALSKECWADLPAGNTNSFTTAPIFWQPNTVNWAIFAGTSDQNWSAQQPVGFSDFTGSGTPATITINALAVQQFGAPDILADALRFQIKQIIHGGDWADTVGTVTAPSHGHPAKLTFPNAAAAPDQFKNQFLSLYGKLPGDTGNVPLVDFLVLTNTATVFDVTPDPSALGIVPGMVFVMRSHFTIAGQVMTNPNYVNAYAPSGLVPGAEVGNLVRIVSGTGAGQVPRQITANDATSLTIEPAWDTAPDATSVVIVEEAKWHPAQSARQSTAALNPAPSTVAVIDAPNYDAQSILVEALVEDQQGNTSLEVFSPLREIYLWGSAGTVGSMGNYQLEVLA